MTTNPEFQHLVERYCDALRDVPEVSAVFSEPHGDSLRFITVLDQRPFDDAPRARLYDVEASLLESLQQPVFEFRVVNLAELDEDQQSALLGGFGAPIYEREAG